MKTELKKRLAKLKKEFQSGRAVLSKLDAKRDQLRQMLMRISGAVQVLEEELGIMPMEEKV